MGCNSSKGPTPIAGDTVEISGVKLNQASSQISQPTTPTVNIPAVQPVAQSISQSAYSEMSISASSGAKSSGEMNIGSAAIHSGATVSMSDEHANSKPVAAMNEAKPATRKIAGAVPMFMLGAKGGDLVIRSQSQSEPQDHTSADYPAQVKKQGAKTLGVALPMAAAAKLRSSQVSDDQAIHDMSGDNLAVAAREIFDAHDKDRSGYIEINEVHGLCVDFGYFLDNDELQTAMSALDIDGDGKVTFEEFLIWWGNDKKFASLHLDENDLGVRRRVGALFQKYDTDKNGTLDATEFQKVHRYLIQLHMTRSTLAETMSQLDANGDGVISFNEMMTWIQSSKVRQNALMLSGNEDMEKTSTMKSAVANQRKLVSQQTSAF